MQSQACWNVFAIRYATAKLAGHHLGLNSDFHEHPGQLDYFVWLLQRGERIILVDTGFDSEEGRTRGREMIEPPLAALGRLGVSPEEVGDVIITHLHYDHAGNLGKFPNARFHLQDEEMRYATGRCMCHPVMRRPFALAAVQEAVALVYRDRMEFHEGDFILCEGVELLRVGGHSNGLQVVRVQTASGLIVLASDALHLGRYLEDGDVFPAFGDLPGVLEGYRKLRKMRDSGCRIVPGHDPSVLGNYPRAVTDWPNIVRIG